MIGQNLEVDSPVATPPQAIDRPKHSGTTRQLRGSSLLLAGKLLASGLKFGISILIVRYLSVTDYGAFAYALSLVALGEVVVTLGLDRAVARFVPIYHERREYDKLFGTLLLSVGAIVGLGSLLVLLTFALERLISHRLIADQQSASLLLILIALSPIQALDGLITSLFAIFASPRSIFLRRYLLAPGLQLIVVLGLIVSGSDATFLAIGYVVANVAGLALYTVLLLRNLGEQGLLARFNLRTVTIPAAEILAFTIPLLSSDLVFTLMNTMDAVLLEHFSGTAEVAAFRAVQPAARLNQLAFSTFTLLFTPLAARLFARNDRQGVNNLYWQTAIWIAIITFPVFALTFSFAEPLTVTLFTARYAQSGVILALLAFGYYFNAALGFNGTTINIYGKVRYMVVVNFLAVAVNLGLNTILIPRHGALGAAIGTCATLVAHNLLKQAGLRLGTGISIFEWQYLRVYLIIAGSAVALLLIELVFNPPPLVGLALAGAASGLIAWLNRAALNIGQTFPELLRIPLLGRLLRVPPSGAG